MRACLLDKATTGAPLPCLEVDVSGGEARGFAVLRPPFGEPDTILTPTRPIVGLEDPRLQAPDAPNYFALAWDARRLLATAGGEAPPTIASRSPSTRASRARRTSCMCTSAAWRRTSRRACRRARLDRSKGAWFRGRDMGPGLELWTYRTGEADLAHVEPFRLARALVSDERAALERIDAGGGADPRRVRPRRAASPGPAAGTRRPRTSSTRRAE